MLIPMLTSEDHAAQTRIPVRNAPLEQHTFGGNFRMTIPVSCATYRVVKARSAVAPRERPIASTIYCIEDIHEDTA